MKLLLENWRKFLKEDTVVPTDINKKAISIYDFDETIAHSDGHIDVSDKETGQFYKRITTQREYDKLAKTGKYDFDFSNLDKVINPVELVPVTNRLRHDVKNNKMQVMILTARAPNAEDEIQMYLDSIGIPPGDLYIVGCAGCDKGKYIEEMVRRNPSIEVVHFYDDSIKNIKDMQTAKERLRDLERVRFFTINQINPEMEIKKMGTSLGVERKPEREDNPRPQASTHKKSMGFLGPGGRIVERRNK